MKRLVLALGIGLAGLVVGCSPGVCGDVLIGGVAENSYIEGLRNADGKIELTEACGADYGSFALSRSDTRITTLVLAENVAGADLESDITVNDIILPAASVVFWNANMVAGKTLTLANLAGSGLHKASAGAIYATYPLTGGTVTFLEGPNNRHEEKLIDTVDWSEEWKVRWSLDFTELQHWDGEDTIKRSKGTDVGTEAFSPPDPEPTGG